jgi:hypothetical protein
LSLQNQHENQRSPRQDSTGERLSNRLKNGRFSKGFSGNPRGSLAFFERQQAARKHADELLEALKAELGGKLSAVDLAFAMQATAMLAKASISEKHRVHLTTKAGAIIKGLRERYARPDRRPTRKELGL